MDTARVVTAICRLAAVLVVAGVVAMHGVTSGHHADLPISGGQPMVMSDTVTGDPVSSDTVTSIPLTSSTVTSDTSKAPTLPGTLLQVCLAVLLLATTMLLGLYARARRRRWAGATARGGHASTWALHVPIPRAPCLFALQVMRT